MLPTIPFSEYYQGCQPGWEKYGDYCYMANVNKMTFEAAQDECAAKGGADLVSIHDAAESAFVETLINEGPECPDDGSEEEYEFEFLIPCVRRYSNMDGRKFHCILAP